MTIDANAIDGDIRRQTDLIGEMLQAGLPGHLADLAAELHILLLHRQAMIASELASIGEVVSDDGSRKEPAPLALARERQLFIKAAAMQQVGAAGDADAAADAYRALVRLRNVSNWWRRSNLQLLLQCLADRRRPSLQPGPTSPHDDAEERAATQAAIRLLIEEMADHAGHDVTSDPATGEAAKQYRWPDISLNEERERALVEAMMPRAAAVSAADRDDSHGRRSGSESRRRAAPDFDVASGSPFDLEPAAGQAAPHAPSSTWQRTPHMDVAPIDRPAPEAEFAIDIYADIEPARPDESSQSITMPSEITRAELDVWLIASDHFDITERDHGRLIIERSKPASNRLSYRLNVKSKAMLDALAERLPSRHRGSVTALFSYKGRPAGQVRRVIEIDLGASVSDADAAGQDNDPAAANRNGVSPPGDAIAFRPEDDKTADMIVRIVEGEASDGRAYICEVTTAHLPSTIEHWRTRERTGDLIAEIMAGLTEEDPSDRQIRARLVSAGNTMFRAAPKNFQTAYWGLLELGRPPASIQIITAEPHFLWEMMIPERQGSGEHPPLGVGATIGRWLTGEGASPPQKIDVSDAYVFAPRYRDNPLPKADEEADFVCRIFDGQRIDPATYDGLIDAVAARGVTLLHFACHGLSDDDGIRQTIELADGRTFTPDDLAGDPDFKAFMRSKRPLVFLNACELGRNRLALAGGGGFPAVFMRLGASAVVAASWSVEDDIAHEIALAFYNRLRDVPDAPLAEIFRDIRKKAYDEKKDSYAAYCFYGDPLAQAGGGDAP